MEKSKFTEEQIFVLHENFPAGNGKQGQAERNGELGRVVPVRPL